MAVLSIRTDADMERLREIGNPLWIERAPRRADGTYDTGSKLGHAAAVVDTIYATRRAFKAELSTIQREYKTDAANRQTKKLFETHSRELDRVVPPLAQIKARIAELQAKYAPAISLDDAAQSVLLVALWDRLPKDNIYLGITYDHAIETGDSLTIKAVESLPRSIFEHALTPEQLAKGTAKRIRQAAPEAANEIEDLQAAVDDVEKLLKWSREDAEKMSRVREIEREEAEAAERKEKAAFKLNDGRRIDPKTMEITSESKVKPASGGENILQAAAETLAEDARKANNAGAS